MNKTQVKKYLALLMAIVLTMGSILPGNSVFASSTEKNCAENEKETVVVASEQEDCEEKLELYDAEVRADLEQEEIAIAEDIVVAQSYGFDVEQNLDGISYDSSKVKVTYYKNMSTFDGNKVGDYNTYYKVEPISGKDAYLICRTISVREPETAVAEANKEENKEDDAETEPGNEDTLLSEGEIAGFDTGETMTIAMASMPVLKTSVVSTYGTTSQASMKVGCAGYAKYCGHSIGIKYITTSGDYHNRLVYCMDLNKNTTSGTVKASTEASHIKPKITYCLVNGARTLNGKCHTSKYSSGNAKEDYFITSAAIHVLNGEVKLKYYNNGSSVYKKIASLVEDAKACDKDKYDTKTGTTISIDYKISPSKSEWKKVEEGLYRSASKFTRTKSGTITNVKYTISGAPSGLTTGEIKTDASEIDDPSNLKKYDICVAQTDASKASSNFYLYCNEEAMKKIQENNSTIKVKAKAYSNEKGGRKWTPTVVSQQKITFLEEFNTDSAGASVKVTSNYKEGSFELKKENKYTSQPVEGATYYLYEDAECTDLLCKMEVTNDDGLALSGKQILTQDKYYVKEIQEADGYLIDEKVYTVGLEYFTLYDSSGKVTQKGKQLEVKETPDKVGVIVYKKDSASGNWVKGAGFAVFKDKACTQRVLTDGDSGSEVPVFYYDEDLDMAASEKFVKLQDTYYVKEVVIPNGYRNDEMVYEVQPEYGSYSEVDATNTAIRCDVEAVKEDKETGTVPQGDATLSGATYGLYAAEEISYPDGRDVVTYQGDDNITSTLGTNFVSTGEQATKDALLATVKTDIEGKFNFGNLYYGHYYIKEIAPSEGYLLDETIYSVNYSEATEQHQNISLKRNVTETVKKQPFSIIKISTDGDDTETDYVKGAEFTVKLQSEVDKVGWDAATTYDILVTDENGYTVSKELPYGTYLVKETKVPKNLYKTDDFTVQITEDSRTQQGYRILNDAPFKAYIRMVKKDAESGETILLPNATFKIKNTDKDVYVEQKVGEKLVSEFTTDDTGTVTTPLKLKYGNYQVEEIKAPEGYLISEEVFPFVVEKDGAVKVEEDIDGEPVIEVVVENTSVKGSISVKKMGEVLVGVKYDTIIDRIMSTLTEENRSVDFEYEVRPLSGAAFHVVTAENIYTSDNQTNEDGEQKLAIINGVPATKGAIIATLTTDENGEAELDDLPLGKYQVIEIKAPKGFVLCDEAKNVELKYADEHTEVVFDEAEIVNERVKPKLSLVKSEGVSTGGAISANNFLKVENGNKTISGSAISEATLKEQVVSGNAIKKRASTIEVEHVSGAALTQVVSNTVVTGQAVSGAAYGLYVAEDIRSVDGDVLVEANDLIDKVVTDEKGKAKFNADLPLAKYYVKEIEAPAGYVLDENSYPVDFTYNLNMEATVEQKLSLYDQPIIVEVSKTDITTGNLLEGASLQIIDSDGNLYAEWISDKQPYTLHAMPTGDYTLREIVAPYGYYIANEVEFAVQETGEIQKVFMKDERVKGKIKIVKTDSKTKKPIEGVCFEIQDETGMVIQKLKTNGKGEAVSDLLDICTYDKSGNFEEDITYYVVETKAAEGYVLDTTKHEVKLQYKNNVTEPVVCTLHLENKPTETQNPKLPQTGGNYKPWLFALIGGILVGTGVYQYRKRKKHSVTE